MNIKFAAGFVLVYIFFNPVAKFCILCYCLYNCYCCGTCFRSSFSRIFNPIGKVQYGTKSY